MPGPQHSRSPVDVHVRTKRMKILLVDSDEADVYLFQEAFRALHTAHELQIAHDGEQALAILASGDRPPALILLEIELQKMHGFEVLSAIRANPALRTLPVVVFAASSDERHVYRAYELGANAYVSKPIDHLVDVVGDLERFWLQRARLPLPPAEPADSAPRAGC